MLNENRLESRFGAISDQESQNVRLAEEIVRLQTEIGGDVRPRSVETMLQLIKQGLVITVTDPERESLVASAYLEPLTEDTYIIGGACSKSKKSLVGLASEILGKFEGKNLLGHTHPHIGTKFLVPLGFQQMTVNEFQARYPDLFQAYKDKRNIPDEGEEDKSRGKPLQSHQDFFLRFKK